MTNFQKNLPVGYFEVVQISKDLKTALRIKPKAGYDLDNVTQLYNDNPLMQVLNVDDITEAMARNYYDAVRSTPESWEYETRQKHAESTAIKEYAVHGAKAQIDAAAKQALQLHEETQALNGDINFMSNNQLSSAYNIIKNMISKYEDSARGKASRELDVNTYSVEATALYMENLKLDAYYGEMIERYETLTQVEVLPTVGDIFSDSWGYDQTNVDFYEVIKVTKKQVVIRELDREQATIQDSMSYSILPTKGQYRRNGKEMRKAINFQPYSNFGYDINSPHRGSMSLWQEGREEHTTHYA